MYKVSSGSFLGLYKADWASHYEAHLNLYGSTGVILAFGDPDHGLPDATTFTTVGEEQLVFTWSESPDAFDTALDLTDQSNYQGIVPVLHVNGSDEEADSPDNAYWSRALAACTVGSWVRPDTISGDDVILAKFDTVGNTREWRLLLNAGQVEFELSDENDAVTPNATIDTIADVAIPVSQWSHIVATYDGSADASGINVYVNGDLVASTDTDDANFISSRDTGGTVTFASNNATPANFFDGKIAGGPLGPFFTQKELSADEVKRAYFLGKKALGV